MGKCSICNDIRQKSLLILSVMVLVILSVVGCERPMTGREKVLFGTLVAANVADAYTTIEMVEVDSRGGHFHELNPVLGKHPDAGNVILFKAGVVGMYWLAGELWPDHREGIYGVGTVICGGAATINWARNERER